MAYTAGTAYLTVVPSFLNIERAFRTEAAKLGKEVDAAIGKGVNDGLSGNTEKARAEGAKAGETYGGAFAEAVRKRLDAAVKDMPKIKVDADTTEADLAIATIRKDLETLRDAKVGVHLDETEFFDEIARIKEEVRALGNGNATIEVRTNAAAALAELEAIQKFKGLGPEELRAQGATNGTAYGGAFETAVQRRLAGVKTAIGDIPVGFTEARGGDAELARIVARADELSHVNIDVDMPVEAFLAEVATLETALRTLSESDVSIRIKSNARQALAEFEALRSAVAGPVDAGGASNPAGNGGRDGEEYGGAFGRRAKEAIDAAMKNIGKIELDANSTPAERRIEEIRVRLETLKGRIGVDVDAADAEAELTLLRFQLMELSRDNVSVDVRVNAARAAAELEAFHQLINSVDRDKVNVDVNADGATSALASFGEQASVSMGRLGTLIAVGALLGTALVPAAAAAAAAISGIAFAAGSALAGVGVFGLGIMGIVKAVTALNTEAKKAATATAPISHQQDQIASALDGVANAQQSLERAERSRTQAVTDLTKAQETARRSLEDMTFSVKSNALAQRQANLDVAAAKTALDLVLANPRATAAEREQAQITYQQKLLQMQQLGVEGQRLAADKAVADKKGVAGSDVVVAAQQKIADATQSVAAAQRQVAASNRALAAAYKGTAVAGTAAMNNVKTAMDALSPVGRQFALFLFGLKGQFQDLQHAAENGMLPGLEQAIKSLLPYEPALKNFVSNVAKALGDSFVYFATALRDPVFQSFFGYLSATAAPTLKGMVEFATNVAKGIAGILVGLTGFNAPLGDGLLKWSEGFATWSETLSTNTGWQKFLGYVKESAPKVVDLLKAIWQFTVTFVQAAAPIGVVVVDALTQIFNWLDKLDAKTWTGIIVGVSGLAGALLILAGATAILTAGPVALTILAIVAIGTGLYILYQKLSGFRNIVDVVFRYVAIGVKYWVDILFWSWKNVFIPTFEGIGTVLGALWKNYWQPILSYFIGTFRDWVDILIWAWKNVFIPTFQGIGAVAMWLWTNVLKPVFGFISAAIGVVGAVAMWLWTNIFFPVFAAIGAAAGWWWSNILQPIFGFIGAAVGVLGAVFMWLWHTIFEPLWQGIEIGWKVVWAILQVVWGLIQIAFKLFALSLEAIWNVFIKPLFQAIVWFVQSVLAPIFTWLWKEVIKPAFEGIYAAVKLVWETLLKPVFSAIGNFIKNDVVPLFQQGMKGLSDAWGGLVDAAKIPVKFIVNTVLNDGLLAAYNWVAKTFGVKPDDVHITLPKGFAGGGLVLGAGGPRDDAILARLSNNEYVIPADIVRRHGVAFFDQIIGRAGVPGGQPGDGSQGLALPGFAAGGLVSDIWGALKTGWGAISDPMKYIRDKLAGVLDKIPGLGWIKDDLVGAEKKTINDVVTWLTGKITNQVSTGVGSLLSPAYVGPVTPDVASVQAWIKTQAGKPYVWAAAGPGGYDCSGMQSAVYNLLHHKSPYSHTFSTANEAQFFPLPGHGMYTVGYAGPGQKGGGRVGHTAGNLAGLPFVSRGGDGVVVGPRTESVDSFAHVAHYDAGGMIQPGWTAMLNGTGRPEPVLTSTQWQDINVLARQGDNRPPGNTYQFAFRDTTLDAGQLRALQDRESALSRQGRAR